MPTLRVDDVELFYETCGAGPSLVFLHGLGSNTRDWRLQLDVFAKAFHCVAFDLPGSGRSHSLTHPRGPFSIAGFARVLAAAMQRLGLAPAHVVGWSMGGMTGLQLALDAPQVVRSLAVVNAGASVGVHSARDAVLLGVRALVTTTLGPRGVARLVAPRLFPKPEQGTLRAAFIDQMSALDPRTYAAVSRALLRWSVETRVASLRCPVRFICAEADYSPVSVKQALAARIPGATVVVVPDTHHALPVENPAAFNAALEAWLATQA